MLFKIHFFKKKNRNIDIDALLLFFESYENKIKIISSDTKFVIDYYDQTLENKAKFIITKNSSLNDVISKLNPQFLDINFRVEFDAKTNFYNADKIFQMIVKISDSFDYYIYNDIFEDVLPSSLDLLRAAYQRYKIAAKNKVSINEYFFVDSLALYDMFKYLDEKQELEKYYQNDDIKVPEARFLEDLNTKSFIFAIEWQESEGIIFPPHLDLVVYVIGNKFYLISYNKIYETIKDYLKELPGFSKGGYYITAKGAKKVKKLMSKILYLDEKRDLDIIPLNKLIEK